ncbi:MAG: adenine-specific methyltransferase EcoRI family protein [Marinilabiliaceae bacterium]|nr:adenine-specific methyltransferase EcoRI family protein [Marinilabiliaceae bacterium]
MKNNNLSNAKIAKNDEFYTRFYDIETEINAYLGFNPNVFHGKTILCPCDNPNDSNFFKYFVLNFQKFKLKKLISTYLVRSHISQKKHPHKIEITEIPDLMREKEVNLFDVDFLLSSNKNQLTSLKSDGDFRSNEIKKLRDESDMIITNPPFSLFRQFLNWIVEVNKQFLIIGNMNAITYKEVFPLIKENKIWLGATNFNKGMYFKVPPYFVYADTYKFDKEIDGEKVNRVPGVCWFTNIEHGKRHKPLSLNTMAVNLSENSKMKGKDSYDRYDNYDAIEVPLIKLIPSDYDGIMGVPISFLNKYCPQQFEIVGSAEDKDYYLIVFGKNKGRITIEGHQPFKRIFIKHRNNCRLNPAVNKKEVTKRTEQECTT